ncbi:glycosyltransferase family 4 protein [Amnibacterium setariae]|uniref:D-inositol 3-phosphate glycosyltransferase n=1 Tax=Amnibacterium setariae TaxID=2306585 RepID=A0A3A1TQX0_9MICO|nr:glycosyltransferase family 4 protein [Amnibacterium setariae]RIX26085.1 glycosyltransferase [Amnibacterium setariae]
MTSSPARRRPDTLRVALVHKMPTPYRVPVFDLIAQQPGIDLTVVYSSRREPNRKWDVPVGNAPSVFLKERVLDLGENKYVHVNWGVGRALARIRPHVVVTNGYNVTDLLVLAFARRTGARVVCQIDGTLESERTLTAVHRLVRRLADRWTDAYVGPSDSTLQLFRTFGAEDDEVFWSPLAVDNSAFQGGGPDSRPYDLLFSGRLTEVKNPLFAIRVAARAAERLGRRVRLLVVGSGDLEQAMRDEAARHPRLDVEFRGFVQQAGLPAMYASAKLFLFPTLWDPWGLVANEAAASGTPTIVSPHAGAAGELIRDGLDGLVVPLDEDRWVDAVTGLLQDETAWQRLSAGAVEHVQRYSWQAAADGYVRGIERAARAATEAS